MAQSYSYNSSASASLANVNASGRGRTGDGQGDISRFIGFYLIPPVCLVGFILNVVSVVVFKRKSFVGAPYSFMVVIALADATTLLITSFIPYARCSSDCPLDSVVRLFYDIYVYLPLSNIVEGISSLMTVSLAIERYLSMVMYFWLRQHSTRRNVFGYIGVITLFSTLMGLPYAFIMRVDGGSGSKERTSFFYSSVYMALSFVRAFVMVVAPLVLLVIFNGLLIRVTIIQRSRRNVRLHKPASTNALRNASASGDNLHLAVESDGNSQGTTRNPLNGPGSGPKAEKRSARDKAEYRLTVMSICIILIFVVGHTPVTFAYAIIWSTFGGTVASLAHISFTRFAQLLLMIALSSNFFMYLHFNKHFKAALTCNLKLTNKYTSNRTQQIPISSAP